MRRIYILGIVFILLALNIPEVTGDIRNKVTFYSSRINDRLRVAKDTAEPVLQSILQDIQRTTVSSNGIPVDTSDTFSMDHDPSITAEQFDAVLREYNSPAAGIGIPITKYAQEKNIDTAYVLYMFIQESTAGTNPNWNADTRNPGNIICAGYHSCIGGFRAYKSWEEGFKAQVDLLADYRDTNGISSIDAAIERWAPPRENDTPAYINGLKKHVSKWRQANKGDFVATSAGMGESSVSVQRAVLRGQQASTDLVLEGCMMNTVPSAYASSPGLQDVSIPPHTDWSFNENWIIVDPEKHICGVVYGGVCDMAARYSNAARKIGLISHIARHTDVKGNPVTLASVDPEDSVGIWSSGGRGGGDLILENTTDRVAYLRAELDGNVFRVIAYFA